MNLYKEIERQMEEGEEEKVVRLVKKCIENKCSPKDITKNGLIASMDTIGVKFRNGELFFPEVLLSASCMHAGMKVLEPYLKESEVSSRGKFLIGTVSDDVHDIGKKLVGMNLKANGFEVIDIGIEVPPENFIENILKYKPDIVGLSALLTTTIPHMKSTIELIDRRNLRKSMDFKILVGGAPVDEAFAGEIGADYYGNDALEAVSISRDIMNQKGNNNNG